MPAAQQSELPLSAVRHRRPCGNRGHAQNVLDCEEWQLNWILETGRMPGQPSGANLTGVINIASRDADRRELRFVTVCLEEFRRGGETNRSADELAELIFGKPQPFVRAQWIYGRLLCKPTHFYDLVEEKVIRLAKGSTRRCGPGGSALVAWIDLVEFVKSRRLS